jgi:4'-phosphopantetheinyl transferase
MVNLADHEDSASDWKPAPVAPVLGSEEVHVWRLTLRQPQECLERLNRTLAPDERDRAERFYFDRHRERFVAARGLLRVILGLYLCRQPESVHFRYGTYGKPALAVCDPLHFNLSHSGDAALLGVTRVRELGVDLEQVRPRPYLEDIARRFFAPAEVAALAALASEDRELAFFNCWTRKEAFIKAGGEGLSRPLDQFTVSLRPGEPARLLEVAGDPDEASRWTLHSLAPWPGFVACLAVRGHEGALCRWDAAGLTV